MNIAETVHHFHLWLQWFNNEFISLPAAVLFFGTALILTLWTGFMQIRGLPRFFAIAFGRVNPAAEVKDASKQQTIGPFQALCAALATSIGMGNVVGPSLAILKGGPGALFWLVIYMLFGSVTKFTEVTFAVHTRERMKDGYLVGGPMEYLRSVSPFLANWYGYLMAITFIGWSGLQTNTMSNIFSIEWAHQRGMLWNAEASIFSWDSLPAWFVGAAMAFLIYAILQGGARRVSQFASGMVPFMFVLYVSFALYILLSHPVELYKSIQMIFRSLFDPSVLMGTFMGATVYDAMRYGLFRGVYISESGMGTSSIPHAMANVKRPIDQGILAMGSTLADITLSVISGLLVIVTQAWLRPGGFRATLIYEVFRDFAPAMGQAVLLISISLFILTTVIGNSFNGQQSFSAVTKHRWVNYYVAASVIAIFCGALMPVPLIWEMTDVMMVMAAVPNLIGILILAFRDKHVLRLRQVQ